MFTYGLFGIVLFVWNIFTFRSVGNYERIRIKNIDNYLDDFLFAGESNTLDCQNLMNNFDTVCSRLGVALFTKIRKYNLNFFTYD